MARVELILTFRGIDLPTVKMTGHDACVFTFRRLIKGRPERLGQMLFAYEEGIIWWTQLIDPEPGEYRLTLLSHELHWAKDVTVDAEILEQGVLRVGFDREQCRRKWFPVFLKRLWWGALEYFKSRERDSRRDERVLSKYRHRFRSGPVGLWTTSHGYDMFYGSSFEFRKDGTGTASSWGDDDEDEEAVTEREFRWRSLGAFKIEVEPVGAEVCPEDWGVIEFDFRVTRDAYDNRQVLMYEVGHWHEDNPGFWWSSHPVVLTDKRS